MKNLFLDANQVKVLNKTIFELEEKFGANYFYVPSINEFSCKCSGPGQSCLWH